VKAYRKGADLERLAGEHLLLQGCRAIIRSAGSHGPVDVVGICDGFVRLVQVTTEGEPVQPRLDALASLCPGDRTSREVWVRSRASWAIYPYDEQSEWTVTNALKRGSSDGRDDA